MTVADGVILLVLIVSGLLAFVRGLTQELLSILAWVTSAAIAIYLYPFIAPWAQQTFDGGVLVGFGAAFVVFLILAAPFYFFSHWLAERLRGENPGNVDRTLGFAFGIGRGLVIVAAVYLIYGLLDQKRPPDWMREARLRPVVEATESALISVLPRDMREALRPSDDASGAALAKEVLGESGNEADSEDTGYSQRERRSLNQLVNTADDE